MQSLWSATATNTAPAKSLTGTVKTDVLIIGGGMAGILCAYFLKQKGVPCIVVEADRIGNGVTANTTAKITAQHGLIYSKLAKAHGLDGARQYLRANLSAIAAYRALANKFPCDYQERTAYVYSTNNRAALEQEAKTYSLLGMNSDILEKVPLPLQTVGALGMQAQAQFHPLKLLYALAQDLDIYEDTFVREVGQKQSITKNGKIEAKQTIIATHFPMMNVPGLYFLKMYQHRSYVIALEGAVDPGGMFVDERQDGHTFRSYGDFVLLGGGDHRTGKKGGGWEELRHLAKNAYSGATERYAWATQDCMTLDGMPYVGLHQSYNPDLYVATGFNKWGMTGSMVAAKILSQMVVGGKSDFDRLINPGRSIFHPQLALNVAHATAGWLTFGKCCSHLGCALKWNPREHTWDCPCHGSRFDKDGQIINNPAKRRPKLG